MCFWESNPTNIESPVFRGNTPFALITQKTLRDPILPLFFLCLSDVGVRDSSFQWISMFFWEIGENSGIEVRIL
jgi:hypothetical protein